MLFIFYVLIFDVINLFTVNSIVMVVHMVFQMLRQVCSRMHRLSLGSCRQTSTISEKPSTTNQETYEMMGPDLSESQMVEDRRELWRLSKSPFLEIPQAWVGTLNGVKDEKISIVDLHPEVFRARPRLDILHRNIVWQQVYRNVQLTKMLSKAEMPGGGKKPWPQKKTGRAHVGSIRAPNFYRGGFAHGVRGPRTWFYMLPDSIRIQGLCVALTIKHVQDDLHIVDRLDTLPEGDPQFLMDMAEERNWGYSVLFVNDTDEVTGGLAEATSRIPSFNVMPIYGLNCYSLLKYDTVVISRKALDILESRLLSHMHRTTPLNNKYKYKDIKEKIMREGEVEEHPTMAPVV